MYLFVELSRRDDLISIGHVLVYFLKGALPWQGLHAKSSLDKYQAILEKKMATSIEELCLDLPGKFSYQKSNITVLY